MSTTPGYDLIPLDVAAANDALRQYVRAHGSRPWSVAELAELDRLRAAWQEAARAGVRTAA